MNTFRRAAIESTLLSFESARVHKFRKTEITTRFQLARLDLNCSIDFLTSNTHLIEVTQHNFTVLHCLGSSLQPIQNYIDFGTETVGLKQYFEAFLHKHKLGQKSVDSMHCYHQNHSGFNNLPLFDDDKTLIF